MSRMSTSRKYRNANFNKLLRESRKRRENEVTDVTVHNSAQQQQQSDFMCSSASTSAVGLNKKRADIPVFVSTPSSHSCPPQSGAQPPARSGKQYQSAACSQLKDHSITVQQNKMNLIPKRNVDHSGSPQPGSLPPEITGTSLANQKWSKNLSVNSDSDKFQSGSSKSISNESALITVPGEKDGMPSRYLLRGNSYGVSDMTFQGNKRGRSRSVSAITLDGNNRRPRSKSLPPSKRRKIHISEPQCELLYETASKATLAKPFLDDMLLGRVTTTCSLELFKKRIPFVKLERLANPEWTFKWPSFPPSQVSTQQDFSLVTQEMGQWFCWVCSKTFPSNENMQGHLAEHRSKNQAGDSSNEHVTASSSKRPALAFFPCNLCQKFFNSNVYLQRHMKCHAEKKWNHQCVVCKETFQTPAILKRHMGNHVRCLECDAMFMTLEALQKHQKSHEPQQVFSCPWCSHMIIGKLCFEKHRVDHKKCSLCGKRFSSREELANHVGRYHTVCIICDETLFDEQELQTHIITIHEKCNLCGEQFISKEDLCAHLKEHPFPCIFCFTAYIDKAQFIQHISDIHQEMMGFVMESMAKNNIPA